MVCGSRPSIAMWATPPSLVKGVLLTMTTTAREPRRPLSTVDRAILTIHGLVAGVVGVIAFVGANDPGWGDLQRLVIVMLIGLWAAGIVAMSVFARMVNNRWVARPSFSPVRLLASQRCLDARCSVSDATIGFHRVYAEASWFRPRRAPC